MAEGGARADELVACLAPLTGPEIEAAVAAARAAGLLPPTSRVISVSLAEPSRAALRVAADRPAPPRWAEVLAVDPVRHLPLEVVVDVAGAQVVRHREIPQAHAPVTLSEYRDCQRLVRADPGFRAGLLRRGVADPAQVLVEPWGIGDFEQSAEDPRRLVWTLSFWRAEPLDNPYAKPLTGLYCLVDLDAMAVLRVDDLGARALPPGRGTYAADQLGALRTDLRPLEIRQPEGVSFGLDGWAITWQRWSFAVGFNAREGMVLHQVNYRDQGRVRPILQRAAVSEIVIPYADPGRYEGWRNAFDIGEYGIGIMTNSLRLGCDCLGEIRYLDATLADSDGRPYRIPNAICLHEEDQGLLWKHVDGELGTTEVRRRRRLVVSFVITAGNYEYAFYWSFHQDGTIECEVRLTGVVLTSAWSGADDPPHGTVVAPGTLAAHHQHFFCFRLDPTVDGPRNRVEEVETVAVPPGPTNPYGNAFAPRRRLLATELAARRLCDPLHGRHWVVSNPHRRNALGRPVGYRLVPQDNVVAFADPQSSVRRRAGFLDHHLWVTAYDPDQRHPAGEFPAQSIGGDGLPRWARADRDLDDAELVMWYVVGSHHIPRPEDWPVMPATRAGFRLEPVGFFDANPALDVAPSPDCESRR
ncbi:MAG TPA: primary-amine oxidase [Verrucomicrobiae bacterium]|nr:primary-amine oxidase [Verrucomicrobiae bacterium]